MNLTQDKTQEIKKELAELHNTLKMSVQKAIRIGQLLTEQKEFIGHGNFGAWMDAHFEMGHDSAYRFMKLYAHADKIPNIGNLQEAYKQIETIEAQEKMTKEERTRGMVAEYRKTGKKPDGWDRSLDYRIKKDEESTLKQKERIEKTFKEREQRATEYKQASAGDEVFSDALKIATDKFLTKSQERNDWKEKIRLSDGGKEDSFMDAIIDYLETLPDDNRRIEACNNIIKICRNISVELQRAG